MALSPTRYVATSGLPNDETPEAQVNGKTRHEKVLILLPVLNEIENIEQLLRRIDVALIGQGYTVCIVDDGSTDGTREFIENAIANGNHQLHLIKRRKTTRGSQRGGALYAAMRWGLEQGSYEIFVEMDGDLSHRPEELLQGIEITRSNQADVAIACKYLPGSLVTRRPLARRLVSRICNASVRLLISSRVRDYSNGYRFYTRAAAELIAGTQIRYSHPIYLTEVLAMWLHHDLRVTEFPTHYVGRSEGLSKLRLTDLAKASTAIFEIAIRHHVIGFRRPTERHPTGALAVAENSHGYRIYTL